MTGVPQVEETGSTLRENAELKAVAYARHFGLWTLADDTALEVDALNGAPGIHTARYAEPQATAAENRRRLLAELAELPLERRGARFVCQLVLADPAGNIRAAAVGHCQGRIALAEAGPGGFGYDSLFEVREYHRTFAQLGPAAKSILSHRRGPSNCCWGRLPRRAAAATFLPRDKVSQGRGVKVLRP